MNERIEAKDVIVIPVALAADIDALTELYIAKLDGDRVAIRRLVETSLLQHGIAALREGLDK